MATRTSIEKVPVDRFYKTLRELEAELAPRVSGGIPAAEKLADPMDFQLELNEAGLALANRSIDYNKWQNVKMALQRIKEESYGVCTDCDSPIPTKRLEAVPWAECCKGCQEKRDTTPRKEEEAA